jgi:hypothetical protein
MLETGETLQTWCLKQLPRDWQGLELATERVEFAASNSVQAKQLADHRLAYLDYEGLVSGDRGSVRRLDSGTFIRQADSLTYSLEGRMIRGEIRLQRFSDDDIRWQLVYQPAERVTDS